MFSIQTSNIFFVFQVAEPMQMEFMKLKDGEGIADDNPSKHSLKLIIDVSHLKKVMSLALVKLKQN